MINLSYVALDLLPSKPVRSSTPSVTPTPVDTRFPLAVRPNVLRQAKSEPIPISRS
jgi:hypothetical protein